MSKISPCLWFDGKAEEAAKFYVSMFLNSRIGQVQRNVMDIPAGKAGIVLVVEFVLSGRVLSLGILPGGLCRSGGGRSAVVTSES